MRVVPCCLVAPLLLLPVLTGAGQVTPTGAKYLLRALYRAGYDYTITTDAVYSQSGQQRTYKDVAIQRILSVKGGVAEVDCIKKATLVNGQAQNKEQRFTMSLDSLGRVTKAGGVEVTNAPHNYPEDAVAIGATWNTPGTGPLANFSITNKLVSVRGGYANVQMTFEGTKRDAQVSIKIKATGTVHYNLTDGMPSTSTMTMTQDISGTDGSHAIGHMSITNRVSMRRRG